jgi:hypothetical protein
MDTIYDELWVNERFPNVRAMEYSDTFHQPSIRHQEKTSAQLEEIL